MISVTANTKAVSAKINSKIGNLKRNMLAVFGKKITPKLCDQHDITPNTEADERKNRAEISIIFSWPWCAEIDRDWFSWRWKIKFFDGIANLAVVEKKSTPKLRDQYHGEHRGWWAQKSSWNLKYIQPSIIYWKRPGLIFGVMENWIFRQNR